MKTRRTDRMNETERVGPAQFFIFYLFFFFEIRRPPGRWPWRVAQLSISASPPSGTGGISGMSGISAEKSTKQKKETTATFHATFH